MDKPGETDYDVGGVLSPTYTSAYSVKSLANEHSYIANENRDPKIVFSPKSGFQVALCEMEKLKEERDKYLKEVVELKLEMCRFSPNRLRFESLMNNDALMKLYTGIPSCKIFLWLCDSLANKIGRMHYYKGISSHAHEWNTDGNRRGPPRILDPRSEILLTLMRLRLNLVEEDLAFRFQISPPLVSSILSTYIPFLGRELKRFIVWPTLDAINSYYPECFRSFGQVVVIIDCTEVSAQKPSLAEANSKLYSPYKTQTTVKVLVGCTPSGAISYISEVSGGVNVGSRNCFTV